VIKEEVDKLLDQAEFKFAKTMPENPHSYTRLHANWKGREKEWFDVVRFMWDNSVSEHWKYNKYYNYYYANGYKYWIMDESIEKTDLINRAQDFADLQITIQAVEERALHVDVMTTVLGNTYPLKVHYDKEKISPLNAFYSMLDIPQIADYRLHMQDDIVFSNYLGNYLKYVVKDMKSKSIDVLTLFTPKRKLPKEQYAKGIKYGEFPNYLWLQATVFSKEFIEIMKAQRVELGEYTKHDDVFVAECLKKSKKKAYCHLPSIIQHDTIRFKSVVGNPNSKNRMSDLYDPDYIYNFLMSKR